MRSDRQSRFLHPAILPPAHADAPLAARATRRADARPFTARIAVPTARTRLARLLCVGPRGSIVLSEHTDEDGATIFRQACVMGLEGIVSKRLSAP